MHSTPGLGPSQSPELRRRLRARARRVKIIRRRVGAATIALFLACFGVILDAGSFGSTSTAGASKVALVASVPASKTSSDAGKTTSERDSSSDADASAKTATNDDASKSASSSDNSATTNVAGTESASSDGDSASGDASSSTSDSTSAASSGTTAVTTRQS